MKTILKLLNYRTMLSLFVLLNIARWFAGARKNYHEFLFYKIPTVPGFLLKGVLLLMLLLLYNSIYAQKTMMIYDIVRKNRIIGTAEATSICEGMKTSYSVKTHVSVWILTDINVDINLSSIYMNGVLNEAWMKKSINGVTKTSNHIVKEGKQYVFTDKDQNTSIQYTSITQSISTLYFLEPYNRAEIFSENFLEQVPIQNQGKSTYKIILPDGYVNYYRYQNGLCKEVEMETPLSTVFLKLKSVTANL